MKFWKSIDWIGSNLGRIKTLGILVVVTLWIISMANNGCDRNEMENMVERITGLNIRNDILQENVKKRDSLLLSKNVRIINLQDSLGASEIREDDLEYDNTILKKKYSALADNILEIPVDSSYQFLLHTAYPYQGILKYPFNEPQVKGFHKTYLEKLGLLSINSNLENRLEEKEYQLFIKDTVIFEKLDDIMIMEKTRIDLDSIIINKNLIIDSKDEQIDSKNKKNLFWKITTAIIALIAIMT